MKILLDENLDQALARLPSIHSIDHVVSVGWQGLKNGQLLAKAEEASYEVFVTADKNLRYQQRMKGRFFAVVVVDVHPNVLTNQLLCMEQIEAVATQLKPGEVYVAQGSLSLRQL